MHLRIIKDEVVVAGDEPLHPTGAVDVLVAEPLHRPLAVQPRATALALGLLGNIKKICRGIIFKFGRHFF